MHQNTKCKCKFTRFESSYTTNFSPILHRSKFANHDFVHRLLTRHVFELQAVHFTGSCVFIVFTCFGVWPCMQGVSDRSIHPLLLCGLKTNKFYTLGTTHWTLFLNLINYFPKFFETQCQQQIIKTHEGTPVLRYISYLICIWKLRTQHTTSILAFFSITYSTRLDRFVFKNL